MGQGTSAGDMKVKRGVVAWGWVVSSKGTEREIEKEIVDGCEREIEKERVDVI